MAQAKRIRELTGWHQGKTRMAKKILPHIPPHLVYVEPFCGSSAVMFAKPVPLGISTGKYVEVINDTNDDLMNLYSQAQLHTDEFLKIVNSLTYSKKIFDHAYDVCAGHIQGNKMQRAVAFYVMITQGFAYMEFSGWGRAVTSNKASTWSIRRDDLQRTLDRIKLTVLDCVDYSQCIDKWDSAHSFFYIDSPYPETHNGSKSDRVVFTVDDMKNLINKLDNLAGSFIMSCYPLEKFDIVVPEDWKKISFETNCSATQTGRVNIDPHEKHKVHTDTAKNKRTEVLYIRERKAELSEASRKMLARIKCFKG